MLDIKNIQTKVDMHTYLRLKRVSNFNGQSLKQTIQEALIEYIKRQEGRIEKDPAFKMIGNLATKEGNWSERDDWR